MKKLAFVLLLLALLTVKVYASTELPDLSKEHDAIGSAELHDSLPDDARQQMDDLGLSPENTGGIASFSPHAFLKAAWQRFKDQATSPARGLGSVLGIIVLAALLDGFRSVGTSEQIKQVFGIVSSLAICAVTADPVIRCISDTAMSIRSCADFVLTFIPIFTGVLVAGGQAVTASGYSMALFAVCQVVSKVASTILVPIMGVYLGFSIIGAISPQLKITPLADAFKTLVTWSLSMIMTVFVGIMTIQSIVAGSGDTVTTKAAKFMIGSFVPVIGGALSEAFTAAQGYIHLLKTTLGAYGMIAAVAIFLPVLVRLVLWYLVTMMGGAVGELFGLKEIAAILKAVCTTLGILMALVLFFILILIISTSVVLVVGQGVI